MAQELHHVLNSGAHQRLGECIRPRRSRNKCALLFKRALDLRGEMAMQRLKLSRWLAIVAMGLWMSPALATDIYLFQWVDSETILTGNTYRNGTLIQSPA